MSNIRILPALALALALGGCSGLNDTQQRAMTGAVAGAAGGAAIGAVAGNAALGAIIGSGAGLVGGFLYNYHKRK
jgi:hypothetical protein